MEMSEIMTAISTLGFPIFMCVMLAWYVKTIHQAYRDDIKTMQQSIDNNTAVMEKVLDKLDDKSDDRR